MNKAACGHVIDVAPQPLSRLLTPEGGEMLREKLAGIGVTWHLGTSVAGIDRDGAGVRVTLANGESFAAEVVLSAIGLRPKLDLAKAAGLTVNRGIVVDRLLQTSAPDVFALGDCAEVSGLLLPFVMPIMNAARALGDARRQADARHLPGDAGACEDTGVPDARVAARRRRGRQEVNK